MKIYLQNVNDLSPLVIDCKTTSQRIKLFVYFLSNFCFEYFSTPSEKNWWFKDNIPTKLPSHWIREQQEGGWIEIDLLSLFKMAISLSVSTSLQNRSLSKFSTKSASSLKWNQFDKNNKIASRTTHKIDDNKLLVQFFVMPLHNGLAGLLLTTWAVETIFKKPYQKIYFTLLKRK